MKKFKISGVIPPVLTPFDENGEPDLDAYGRLLDFLLEHVHGLYPLGTYGSGPLMPKEMRIKLADFVVEKVNRPGSGYPAHRLCRYQYRRGTGPGSAKIRRRCGGFHRSVLLWLRRTLPHRAF